MIRLDRAGPKSPRRARVQPGPEGSSLGEAEAGAGSVSAAEKRLAKRLFMLAFVHANLWLNRPSMAGDTPVWRYLRQSVTNHFDGGPRQSSQPSYGRDRGGDQIQTDNQFCPGGLDTDAALSRHALIFGRRRQEGRKVESRTRQRTHHPLPEAGTHFAKSKARIVSLNLVFYFGN